jgi:hypothetical protein
MKQYPKPSFGHFSHTTTLWQSLIGLLLSCAICTNSLAEKPTGKPGSISVTQAEVTYFALERDTLTTIAKQFTDKASNWDAIGKRNNIRNDRTIPVGSGIIIPAELLTEEASSAKVVALAGKVIEIKKNGVEAELEIGSIVTEGSQILTSKNSFASLVLSDDSRVSVPSNSQINFAKLRITKLTKSPRTEIKLVQGRIESKITPLSQNKGRYEVTSPLAIAGVRGTHFRVGINDNGVGNEVLEGTVAVGKKETPSAILLPAGQGNVVSATSVGKAINLLPAPNLVDGFQLQERPSLQFMSQAVSNAVAYHAQISTDVEAQNIVQELQSKEGHFKFDGLDDGNYFIRVTAIDALHLEGMPNTLAFVLKARPEPPFLLQPKHKVRSETVTFTWTETNVAKSYRLQVASDAQFKNILIDQDKIKEVEYGTSQLGVGNYFWRVATIIEKNGKMDQGPFSPLQSFNVLAAQSMNPVTDTGENTMNFSWPSEPGQSFLVQIAQDPDFNKIYFSQDLAVANVSIPRPETGTYFIRVRATDADRFIGNFSPAQKFEIRLRWTTGSGEPLNSAGGAVRPVQ